MFKCGILALRDCMPTCKDESSRFHVTRWRLIRHTAQCKYGRQITKFQIVVQRLLRYMTDTSDTSVNLYDPMHSKMLRWIVPLVGTLCGISFFVNLDQEPHFVDESAYVSQAYFGDLLITGNVNSPLWFEYPGFDLPPLTKYLVWAGLVSGGDARPGPAAMRAWYTDTSKRFETSISLTHARNPIALCALITVIATGLIAQRWKGPWVAVVAMLLLSFHPLFRTHARRAMADIPTEMGVVLALLVFLPTTGKTYPTWSKVVLGGIATGLAASSKLNGLLAGIVLVVWWFVGGHENRAKRLFQVTLAGLLGAGLFVVLNPFLYGTSNGLNTSGIKQFEGMGLTERLWFMMDHRLSVSGQGQKTFPNDALKGFAEKAKAMAIQGFGRFSPFGPRPDDSRVRYQWSQDWSSILWIPWVLAGAVHAARDSGANQNQRRILAYWVCAVLVVGAFLPMAWNRYYLPLAIPSILLAAGAVGWCTDWLIGRWQKGPR